MANLGFPWNVFKNNLNFDFKWYHRFQINFKKKYFEKEVQGNEGTFKHLLQRGYRHKNGMNIHRSFFRSHYNSFFLTRKLLIHGYFLGLIAHKHYFDWGRGVSFQTEFMLLHFASPNNALKVLCTYYHIFLTIYFKTKVKDHFEHLVLCFGAPNGLWLWSQNK